MKNTDLLKESNGYNSLIFCFCLPSTSAENPVGSSFPWVPSSKIDILTSFLANITCGLLPPCKHLKKHILVQFLITSFHVFIVFEQPIFCPCQF